MFVLISSLSTAEERNDCTFSGWVLDKSGNMMKDTVIILDRISEGVGNFNSRPLIDVTKNSGYWKGTFEFTRINSGNYKITVYREGYKKVDYPSVHFFPGEQKVEQFVIEPADTPLTLIITNRSEFLKVHSESPLVYPLINALPDIAEYPPISGDRR